MATLLTIAQDALKEDGRWQVPATIVGNSDPTAVQLLALANRTGRVLAYDHSWQVLVISYTFPTVASTTNYALPSDFHHFVNLTQWNRTAYAQMVGPVSPRDWEALQSGLSASAGIDKAFRIYGNRFYIYPTPTSVETIAYQYYSANWISGKPAFTADADVPLLDADLFTLGIRYRFLRAKGLPYDEEKGEYISRRDSLLEKDGGKGTISFGGRVVSPYGNLPETAFGI